MLTKPAFLDSSVIVAAGVTIAFKLYSYFSCLQEGCAARKNKTIESYSKEYI